MGLFKVIDTWDLVLFLKVRFFFPRRFMGFLFSFFEKQRIFSFDWCVTCSTRIQELF